MKYLIYLVVFFLLLNGFTTNKVAISLIRDSCKKVAEFKPDYYKFCIASIEENLESKKVKNVIGLIVLAVANANTNMTNVRGIVMNILKERKYKDKTSEKAFRECLEWYTDGGDSLARALLYLKRRDDKKLFESISDARGVPKDCQSKLASINQTSLLKKENEVLYKKIDIAQLLLSTMPK